MTVKGKGNYTGYITVKFTIVKKSIEHLDVSINDEVYTGSAITPTITVKNGEITLVEGVDYTVYSVLGNQDVGQARTHGMYGL